MEISIPEDDEFQSDEENEVITFKENGASGSNYSATIINYQNRNRRSRSKMPGRREDIDHYSESENEVNTELKGEIMSGVDSEFFYGTIGSVR